MEHFHSSQSQSFDVAALWSKGTAVLKTQLDPQLYSAWIQPLSICTDPCDNNEDTKNNDQTSATFSLFAPNKFCRDHVERHYRELISKALCGITGNNDIALQFRTAIKTNGNTPSVSSAKPKPSLVSSIKKTRPSARAADKRSKKNDDSNLNTEYNFSNYVVGNCNQFAHAASLRVAENPGTTYNPLFLYGGVGLGKTHLANAIGNASRRRGKKVMMVSSEYFVNELIHSLRTNNMQQFKSRFRSLDVLVIDDIQFLIGKERTQEEFFHTFNELHQRRKQVIITSDKTPQELIGLEERLRTRFSSGLSADLQTPDYETRVAILTKKSEHAGIIIPEDVAGFLAETIDTNIRELEGALNRIHAMSSLYESPIDMHLARSAMDSIKPLQSKEVTTDLIQQTVASKFNVSIGDLLGKRRTQNIALARHVAMYLCRKLTGRSYPEVGAVFGGRDHSTAIHACKKLENTMNNNSELKEQVESLERRLIS